MSGYEDNLTKAQDYLRRFRENVTGHFIDGQFEVPSEAQTFENLTPADNTSLGDIVAGSEQDIDRACEAAQAAFAEWRDVPGATRKRLLNRFADMVVERAEEIALVESMDCGQAIRFMKQAALRGADNFRFFADKAPEAVNGQALYQDAHTNYTMRSPVGPVGYHYALEYALHVVNLENRAGPGCGLYCRTQAS